MAYPATAHAMRPFDGTDAAVTEEGELEIEFGPAFAKDGGGYSAVTMPALAWNLGVAPGWELSVDTTTVLPVTDDPSSAYDAQTEVQLKTMLRDGCLQGGDGPSVASELRVTVSDQPGEMGRGSALALIASQQFESVTLHFNGEISRELADQYELFGSVIVQGSEDLVVRPASELAMSYEIGASIKYSAAAVAIWQLDEALALDAGAVASVTGEGTPGEELRFGLTWSTVLWHAHQATPISAIHDAHL